MEKSLLQKILFIFGLFTLFLPIVSALDDDTGIELDGDVNIEMEGDTEIENNKFKDEEDRIRNLKMPHVDDKKEKIIEKIEIPKIIHQYVRSKDSISEHTQKNINSWKSLNSDWEHKLYDFDDIKNFMETHHSKVIDLWNVLEFEEKIHMWKYAILETFGGVYADADCYCVKPINQWIEKYNKSNILIGLDYLYIPDKILTEKKLTDSIEFNVKTIVSAPGHEILSNMAFYIHRFRVLGTLKIMEIDPDYKKKGRIYFSVGEALWTESVFNYLIENNVILKDIVEGGLVKDVAVLPPNSFSYEANNLSDLPDDALSVYFPEKSKTVKEKNDYII
ncbi:hypothetical protein BCR32DRAFT_296840 [Anaeromyces robustus]|uniref:Glycosyltransferase family 32 protein n=1 Tax=Anaeromyces robustus TaxID=1754192 RepID=A0A1Y1WQZ3_9FUNG|nr:hypothetical protein BCR32DRAFT_296840 [Anaeromyces robustus]|eukprot:ORX75544.1 hypothetical protein BCR32DRAFT_296840 [Anaeromyces robustus]